MDYTEITICIYTLYDNLGWQVVSKPQKVKVFNTVLKTFKIKWITLNLQYVYDNLGWQVVSRPPKTKFSTLY